ncbi:hypothetical protein SDC9_06127 [bioreactor metagenome]|uniref:Uncharacterized protein n=1 Tax=bioreactor metagenome TaxID=1076179 RepID=A0A644T133_9ZZZZ
MSISRISRKRENSRALFKRVYTIVVALFIGFALIYSYYINVLIFAVLSIVIFFGIISLNFFNIRNFIPGICAQQVAIRLGAAVFYLVAAFLLISKIGLYSHK